MRSKFCLPAALCCLIIGLSAHAMAIAAELPKRGMSMDQVAQAFGKPLERMSAVGDPPITRWVYEGYTVYFDRNHVIHSVTSQPLTVATDPAVPEDKAAR